MTTDARKTASRSRTREVLGHNLNALAAALRQAIDADLAELGPALTDRELAHAAVPQTSGDCVFNLDAIRSLADRIRIRLAVAGLESETLTDSALAIYDAANA